MTNSHVKLAALLTFLFSLVGVATSELKCPDPDTPALFKIASGTRSLMLCGAEETTMGKPPSGMKHVVEFELFLMDQGKKGKSYLKVGALDNYWVSQPKPNELVLEEVWYMGGTLRPAFTRTITCTDSDCILSDEKCVIANSLKEVKISKKLAVTDRVFVLALRGDQKYAHYFSKKPAGLDGAAAEDFTSNAEKVERARKAGCAR